MKLISTVTHRGERDAVLTFLEDGGSFLAPVGELVRGLVASDPKNPEVKHRRDQIPPSKPKNPPGAVDDKDKHPPEQIPRSTPRNPPGQPKP